jgi:ubiquitin C-terminal hydrolase
MEKGIIGLKNRGNTCYLNTSIQCLNNLPLLTDYFISNKYLTDINNRCHEMKGKKTNEIILAREYSKLVKAIANSNTPIEPKSLHQLIQTMDEKFEGYEQQDSQESMALILDNLHEGLKYDVDISYSGNIENSLDEIVVESIKNWKNDLQLKYSIIAELFFGQFINKVISLEDHNKDELISKKFEMFNMLNIPIYGKTLYDSLSKYFEKEILESKYLDEKSNQYLNTYRQIKLMKVPKYLIIVLKRYRNMNTGNLLKSNNMISFPIDNLDLSSYSEGYDTLECNLRLISIGCHRGVLNGGHYYAICRAKNDLWYKCDDQEVEEYSIESNKNNLFKDGYILIYEKME